MFAALRPRDLGDHDVNNDGGGGGEQIPHLSLLYLQHWKRWDFVSAFVLSGGLHTLCSLFAHDNPVVRLKAITTLVSITAHREFDWFTPPPRARAAGPGGVVVGNNTTEARLHRALLGLRQDPAFIPGLIANSWGGRSGAGRRDTPTAVTGEEDEEEEEEEEGGGGSFPGACLMCLEVSCRAEKNSRTTHDPVHQEESQVRASPLFSRAAVRPSVSTLL